MDNASLLMSHFGKTDSRTPRMQRREGHNPPRQSSLHSAMGSEQPHVHEQECHGREEAEPDLPAHAGAFGHEQHAVHGAPQADAGRVEGIVHLLREGGRVADLVPDGVGHLGGVSIAWKARGGRGGTHLLQDLDLAENSIDLRVVLALELVENGITVLAPGTVSNGPSPSFIPTRSMAWSRAIALRPIHPVRSRKVKTYFLFGVADLNPPFAPDPTPGDADGAYPYPYPPPGRLGLALTGLCAPPTL